MRTKKIITDMFDKIAVSETVYFDIPDYVYLVHKFPYKRHHAKNGVYHYACQFLQAGTNMLAVKVGDEFQPATIFAIRKMSGIAINTFDKLFYTLVADGIIMAVNSGRLKRYYMNPAFARAGDHLPKFLIDMFKVSGDKIIGEHMFANDNELYNDNRNKDFRFGSLRNRTPYKGYGKRKKTKRKKK